MAFTNDNVHAISAQTRYGLPVGRRYVDSPELITQDPPKVVVVRGNRTDGENRPLMLGWGYAPPPSVFNGGALATRRGREKLIGSFLRHFGSPFPVPIDRVPDTRCGLPIAARSKIQQHLIVFLSAIRSRESCPPDPGPASRLREVFSDPFVSRESQKPFIDSSLGVL